MKATSDRLSRWTPVMFACALVNLGLGLLLAVLGLGWPAMPATAPVSLAMVHRLAHLADVRRAVPVRSGDHRPQAAEPGSAAAHPDRDRMRLGADGRRVLCPWPQSRSGADAARGRLVLDAGARFIGGFALGRDATLAELVSRHDAVLLALGAYRANRPALPGADEGALIDGLTYLLASMQEPGAARPDGADPGRLNACGRT